jgi:4-amino-4-deoxy-L-arabinose transferase-like glycosyltransferase
MLAFHLAVAWQDIGTLARNGFLYDDGFYAFKIAENIADGKGATFDGIHPTTGFQPLYVFLLVPAFMLSGDNLVAPIYIALSLLAVFTCLTAYFIYRICARYVGRRASLTAALIWAFSPIVTKQSANGLETALATLMIAVAVCYYLERIRSVENPGSGRFMILGILLGIMVLARIDGVLLILVMMLDYLVLLRARRVPSRRLARLSFVPIGVCILYGPWLVFNMVVCGSPLQDSGAATRFLSLAYAGYFGYGSGDMASRGPDASFIWAHLRHAISTMKVIPPMHLIFRSIDRAGGMLGSPGSFHVAGNVIGFLVLGGVGFSALGWRRNESRKRRGETHFLILFAAVLMASYALYVFGMFFFLRYFYPVYLIACIYFAFLLQDVFEWYARRSLAMKRAVIAASAVYAALFGFFSYSQAFRSKPIYPFYDVSRWVRENTGDAERIGVFQCGTIGYLSNRRIINLDGKVNRGALEAMKSGRLESYLREQGIEVVIDHSDILKIFFADSRGRMPGSCTDIVCREMQSPSGWIAYRWPAGVLVGSSAGAWGAGRAGAVEGPPASGLKGSVRAVSIY